MYGVTTQLRWSIPHAAKLLGISPATLWRRINSGYISTVRDGHRVFITDAEVRRYAEDGHR